MNNDQNVLLNGRFQDLRKEIAILNELNGMEELKVAGKEGFKKSLQKRLAKRLGLKANADLEDIKAKALELQGELQTFVASFGLVGSLENVGAKANEIGGLRKFQNRMQGKILKVLDITTEEFNAEGEE
jgi:hypothetical protein